VQRAFASGENERECALLARAGDGARARRGLDGGKSTRRLEASGASTGRGFGRKGGDEEGEAVAEVRGLDWSAVGALGSGERCALAVCTTDGACEAFAPPSSRGTCEWRHAVDLSRVWLETCERNEYGHVNDACERMNKTLAPVRREDDRFLLSTSLSSGQEQNVKNLKNEVKPPPTMPSTSLDGGDELMMDDEGLLAYGALRSGARVEVSFGSTTAPPVWRVGTIVSAHFNVATRVRVKYDNESVHDEFIVWNPAEVKSNGEVQPVTIPSQECLGVRRVRPLRSKCCVRPFRAYDVTTFRTEDVRAGSFIEISQDSSSTWRLAQVASVTGSSIRVRLSERGEECVVDPSDCRMRSTWLGSERGWVRASDKPRLPKTQSEYMDDGNDQHRYVDDSNAVGDLEMGAAEDDDSSAATASSSALVRRAVNEFLRRRQSDVTYADREKMNEGDITLFKDVCEQLALSEAEQVNARTAARQLLGRSTVTAWEQSLPPTGKSRKSATSIWYDDQHMKRAELLQLISCAWSEIPAEPSSDRVAHILACGTKSGHVVVFHISDDAVANVVTVQRVADKAWLTSLAWLTPTKDRVTLLVGCSDGSIIQASGDIKSARVALKQPSTVSNLFADFQLLDGADGAAVTCASVLDELLIVGKTNGDVFLCDLSRQRSACKRRVSLEPIAGVCWSRGSEQGVSLAHVVSGTTHLVFEPFASADHRERAFFCATDASSLGKHPREGFRAIEASRGIAPSPAADAVARCDVYVQTSDLRNLTGFKLAKFERGEIVVWRVPAA